MLLASAAPVQKSRGKNKAVKHSAVESAPKPASPKVVGAAGLIAVAQHQLDNKNFSVAADYAQSAASKVPALADYAHFIRAQAEYELHNYSDVAESAKRIFDFAPPSPLVGPVAALAVRADLDGNSPKQALELIKKYFEVVPQPQADLLLARCFGATDNLSQAAEYFQRVYYEYPSSKEATDAANALVDLKAKLGDAFPRITPSVLLKRAQKLFDVKNPAGARIELAAAIPQLAGAEQDLARVRLGVADFLSNQTSAAFTYLSSLKVDDPEADAERLNYLIRCARKSDRHADVKPFLLQLEQQHAISPWRLDALIFVADGARTENNSGEYLPLYQACAGSFPKDHRSAWCHWRLAFESYRKDGTDSYDLLRSHVQQYPASEDINNSLYFLGRLQERKNDNASAKACYEELIARFPNTYYTVVARERLKQPSLQAATASPEMKEFLQSVEWPSRPEFPSFLPGDLAKIRISRAQLLQLTGLTSMAEDELKFGATNDGKQANVYAYELAKLAAGREASDQALRYIKRYAPGYLHMPYDQAPLNFWQLAFPMPYRSLIDQHSQEQSLDRFFVAALIRQESEFNPVVISHANAYGLMQVLPATGRMLAKRSGVRRFSASQLLTADRNIQLGTLYVRNLMNSFGGQEEYVLASYNAGPGRAKLWQTWGPYREQPEFIETIPFHETRQYVQVVLRNADTYRRLYAGTVPEIPAYHPKPAPKVKVTKKRVRRG
ncbi:MAG: transglycosylase SLT domain-containing protein [Bryobacteraceae bacterium]